MSAPRIGSLFHGYGGLDMAVQAVIGGELAWVSEIDKGALKVIAHHHPDVPNLGDITKVDWSQVEPVDVLTGGSPCQDLSHAGKRQGMTEGTRSNLWVAMREAIAQLRPSLVIWENVRGASSACADSELGRCPRCVDPDSPSGHAPLLRALGRVCGDLAELGFDAEWVGLRAADVGAPHGRFRYFLAAWPADSAGHARRFLDRDVSIAGHPASLGRIGGQAQQRGPLVEPAGNGAGSLLPTPTARDPKGQDAPGRVGASSLSHLAWSGALLPTPRAGDGEKGGPNQRGSSGDLMLPSAVTHLLPTPAVNDMGEGKTPEAWDAWTARMKAEHGNGNGHGPSLAIEAMRLLLTTTSSDYKASGARGYRGNEFSTLTDATVRNPQDWGQYADAIRRWETLTRPAPPPTETGPKGSPRLSARFSEWLMGLPAGWITDVPGVTRNEALRLAGNGVVPQQGAAATALLLERAFGRVAA